MRLWLIQPENFYEKLKIEKILYCDPAQSKLAGECGFDSAYDWLAEQMSSRVGPPPAKAKYPFLAWHTMEWKHQKPDLRRMMFRGYSGNQVCLELEVPDKDVLLINGDMWHMILNDGCYRSSLNPQEYELENKWFKSLPPQEQLQVQHKSWEKIFDVSTPPENKFESQGKYIQAAFWELWFDQVTAMRHFKGRIR
jgi:hypothetical protein